MTKTRARAIDYGPEFESRRGIRARWVENASDGLRLVGFADEIAREHGSRIDHQGWYTDDDGTSGEVYRGVVYQLPASGGEPRYIYGYADPCNYDCAMLCFDVEPDKMEAARMADRIAEIFAEDERDYSRASNARSNYDQLAEDVDSMRTEALAIGAEMRQARKVGIQTPTICATLSGKVLSLYRHIQRARKERQELLDNFGHEPGWAQ